jgi:hypothetical protein
MYYTLIFYISKASFYLRFHFTFWHSVGILLNNNVTSMSITSEAEPDSVNRGEEFSKIVVRQTEVVLLLGTLAFPELRKLTLSLPSEGRYLNLVQSSLPQWKHLKDTHFVRVKNDRIHLEVKKNICASRKMQEKSTSNVLDSKISSHTKESCHDSFSELGSRMNKKITRYSSPHVSEVRNPPEVISQFFVDCSQFIII